MMQKKKKFPSHSTCTYTEEICIFLTRVYYCWGLPSSSEGYFVLRAALSLTTVTPPVSLMWIIWWCGDTQFEIHRPFHSEYLHLSAASMSTKLSDCVTQRQLPSCCPPGPPASLPEEGGARKACHQEAQVAPWLFPVLQRIETVPVGGNIFFFFFFVYYIGKHIAFFRETNCPSSLVTLSSNIKRRKLQGCKGPVPEEHTQGNFFF